MVSDWQKYKIIQEFLIPDELKDDIAYCQRSLRDCVKVHQYLTERCKDLQEEQQALVKRYRQELDAEMRAIGKEQNGLVADLMRRLKQFKQQTATERHIELADDLANGYVAWVLSNHCEVNGSAGMCQTPHKVSERLSEWQLYQKYRLESIPLSQTIEEGSAATDEGTKRAEKRLRTRPVLQTSLLKPATERTATPESVIVKPKVADSLTPPVTPPSPTQSVQQSPPSPVMAVKTVAATSAGGGSNKRKATESSAMVESKILRSRSANVGGAPAKGGKGTVEPLEDTLEPGDTFDDSSASSVATDAPSVTAAMKRSRSSLYQALNKAKLTQKTSPPNSATKGNRGVTAAATTTVTAAGAANGRGNESAGRATSVSSDSSNSRSSTPGSSRKAAAAAEPPVTSDDSSNERFLPPEDYCPPPDTIHEWEQYTFLKLYGLYTLEDSRLLKERKNERKRRSCCSTERKDFHYGRYDQFEQQYYVLSKRRTNGNKRPALLYTATTVAERCMNHRKQQQQQQQQQRGGGSWSTTSTEPSPPLASSTEDVTAVVPPKSRSESPVSEPVADSATAVLEPDNKICFVCNEPGTSDSLSACGECCNIYHINCHTDTEEEKTLEKTLPTPALEPPAEDNTLSIAASDGTTAAADCATMTDGSSMIDDKLAVQILPPQRDNLCPGCFKIAQKAQLRAA
uniref:Uncharacterized protein n=1 Tax=Anopheles triannulatus TaxID=58253 RepID=A0A2M4AND6_9DIPT